jgi:DHA3 family macrolide efflux protein-like MFS transporter
VWADRYDRKFLIVAADALTALSTLVLAVFFLTGFRELWLIFVVSGIRSIGGGIQGPAVGALLPQIVPTEKLMRVNSINGTIQPIILIAAPVAAGAMLASSPLEAIFMIDVVTALIAIGLLLALKVPPHARAAEAPTTGYLDDLREGVRYIHNSYTLRKLFAYFAFVFFLITPVVFLSPLLVTRSYGPEVWRLTLNEITFFVGSIIGGVIMTAWGGFENRFKTIGLGSILWAALFVGLGLSRDFTLYLVLMFLSGVPMPFFNASTTTLLQEMVDSGMQGRVFSVMMLITNIVMPLGMVLFGPIADRISIETLMVIASALMFIPSVWIFLSRPPVMPAPLRNEPDPALQPGD